MSDYNKRMQAMADARIERIKRLKAAGMKWKEIAEIEGCTRQRLWRLVNKNGKTKK